LPYFVEYGRWFQRNAAPDVEPTYARRLAKDGEDFTIELQNGRAVTAGRVVVAIGIRSFKHLPDFARDLPESLASHTQDHPDLGVFRGRRVAIVGSGQSALEWAALLHEAGADVELIARGPVHWVDRKFYDTPARRIFYPPTDVGPPGINWLIAFPLLMRRLPARLRLAMHRRAVRPAGAKWLRPRVDGVAAWPQRPRGVGPARPATRGRRPDRRALAIGQAGESRARATKCGRARRSGREARCRSWLACRRMT
jgi:cation diffusion facilitator CzcD-associated flavoprotein CzcO